MRGVENSFRGSEWGVHACRLKFHNFVGCLLNFSTFVGCRLVSSAAVFWDVTQRSPQRNGCSQPNNILFLLCLRVACGLLNRPII